MKLLNKIKKKIKGMFVETPIKVAGITIPFVPLNLNPSKTVPAPEVLSNDPWFGDPVLSEESKDYMERETEFKKQEQENRQYWTNESENIHQEMYDLATKNGKTTVQLDPVGGSETFQEGPGGWMSGTGYQGQGLTDH